MRKKTWQVEGATHKTYQPPPPKPVVSNAGLDAKTFMPHAFNTQITLGQMQLLISRQAYEDMLYFTGLCIEEIAWLGTVKRNGFRFLIEEVFLADQEVHGSEAKITTEGLTNLGTELMARKDCVEVWNNLRFWGHSHVRMGTEPSSQDHTEFKKLIDAILESKENQFFIRGIVNKLGRMEFTVFIYADNENGNIVITDMPWQVYEPSDQNKVKRFTDLIKDKVWRARTTYQAANYAADWVSGQNYVTHPPLAPITQGTRIEVKADPPVPTAKTICGIKFSEKVDDEVTDLSEEEICQT